jgi:hypothetical protein
MKRIVYKSTRNSLKEILPNLSSYNCKCKEEDHWNLLRVVLFSSYREETEVRVGAEAVARATNKLNQLKAGRFNAGVVIDHFINDIFPFAQIITDEFGREWSKSTWEQREDGSYKKMMPNRPRATLMILAAITRGSPPDNRTVGATAFKPSLTCACTAGEAHNQAPAMSNSPKRAKDAKREERFMAFVEKRNNQRLQHDYSGGGLRRPRWHCGDQARQRAAEPGPS